MVAIPHGKTPEQVECRTCRAILEKRQIHEHHHNHRFDTQGHSKVNCRCGKSH